MILGKSQENGVFSSDMTNFGASFKKARESKGISLDQIAAETRISTRFLLAIENEEFHSLPGGIFNRGFVRAYAEKVGLDPDGAVAEYERLAEIREPGELPAPETARAKRDRHLYPVAIIGLILLIVIFYVATRESSNTAQTASPAPQRPPASAPPVVQPPPPPPTTPPVTTSAAPEPEAVPPSEAVRIDMEVKETTWIKVEADGITVNPGEILEPGMTRHFTAQNSIDLVIGNAAGLGLKINDMPAKNLGKSGQVRELNITPSNFKSFIG